MDHLGVLWPPFFQENKSWSQSAVDYGQNAVLKEQPLGHFVPQQIQGKGQDGMHDGLRMVETHIADQTTRKHLLLVHVLQ